MRIFILSLIILSHFDGLGQNNIDCEFIFKTQLFLEKVNVVNIKYFEVKNKYLLNFFDQNIKLKLDTVKAYGFSGDYIILSLSAKDGIVYNESVMKSDSSFLVFIDNDCSKYILAVNKFSGRSYRLKGFNGNDIYNLFVDLNRQYEKTNSPKITYKTFARDYSIDSVDIGCLLNALKSGEYNKLKYPCISSCEIKRAEIH